MRQEAEESEKLVRTEQQLKGALAEIEDLKAQICAMNLLKFECQRFAADDTKLVNLLVTMPNLLAVILFSRKECHNVLSLCSVVFTSMELAISCETTSDSSVADFS